VFETTRILPEHVAYGGIGTAIVGDHDLERPVRLSSYAIERDAQIGRPIVAENDEADSGSARFHFPRI
jgi:hypothetical protein